MEWFARSTAFGASDGDGLNIMALNTAQDAIEAKRLELVAALRLRGRTQREIQQALALTRVKNGRTVFVAREDAGAVMDAANAGVTDGESNG